MVPILLLLFLSGALKAADSKVVEPEIIQARFAQLRQNNNERALTLRTLFAQTGCKPPSYSEDTILSSKLPNVTCILPGSSRRIVVVSAHFDNRGPGEGAIDNWSGASLLPSLYESLRTGPRRFTYEFIGFTDEEKGLIGSRDYVGHLSKEHRASIFLDVNIDSIGLPGPIRVWAGRSDDLLLTSAAIVADETKLALAAGTMDKQYDSDAAAFMAWRIPTIDFHSLTPETIHLLHTKRDVRGAVDLPSYYGHYRFLVAYLDYIDKTLDLD